MFRLFIVTTLAMLGFAANSILNRLALTTGEVGAVDYTGIRLASGAVALLLIHRARAGKRAFSSLGGSWSGAAALLGYALCFSIAYLKLGAGTGALILFASVQAAMLLWAVRSGERPALPEWIGFALAFVSFIILSAPGITAPAPVALVLMVLAGLSWATYSLIGRASSDPLADTTGNFVRCLPVAIALVLIGWSPNPPSLVGWVYAVVSGAIASGVCYTLWYAALPQMSRTTAAFVQLTVPVIAATGGVVLIGEPVTLRLVVSSIGILGGVALAVCFGEMRRGRTSRSFLNGRWPRR